MTDTVFWGAIGKTVLLGVAYLVIVIPLATLLASMLNRIRRGSTPLKVIYFLPQLTSSVAIAIMFNYVFQPDWGLVNGVLRAIGITHVPLWLADPRYNFTGSRAAVTLLAVWAGVGYFIIVILAGLQSISGDLYDAAAIDGANPAAGVVACHTAKPQADLRLSDHDRGRGCAGTLLRSLDPGWSGRFASPLPAVDRHVYLPAGFRWQRLLALVSRCGGILPYRPGCHAGRVLELSPPRIPGGALMEQRLASPLATETRPRWRLPHDWRSQGLTGVVLWVGAFFMAVPFLWMLTTSLSRKADVSMPRTPSFWPQDPSFFNYKIATDNLQIVQLYANSLIVVGATTAGYLFFCSLAGYAFAKGRFPFKSSLFILFLATLFIPFETRMIPLYLFMGQLHLTNTYFALILPFLAGGFGTFLMRQTIAGIPDELVDAAHIDGALRVPDFLDQQCRCAGRRWRRSPSSTSSGAGTTYYGRCW